MVRAERNLPELPGTFALHMEQVAASVRSYKPYCAEGENIDLFVGLQLVNHLNSQTSVPLFCTELPVAAESTGVRLAPARLRGWDF